MGKKGNKNDECGPISRNMQNDMLYQDEAAHLNNSGSRKPQGSTLLNLPNYALNLQKGHSFKE